MRRIDPLLEPGRRGRIIGGPLLTLGTYLPHLIFEAYLGED